MRAPSTASSPWLIKLSFLNKYDLYGELQVMSSYLFYRLNLLQNQKEFVMSEVINSMVVFPLWWLKRLLRSSLLPSCFWSCSNVEIQICDCTTCALTTTSLSLSKRRTWKHFYSKSSVNLLLKNIPKFSVLSRWCPSSFQSHKNF